MRQEGKAANGRCVSKPNWNLSLGRGLGNGAHPCLRMTPPEGQGSWGVHTTTPKHNWWRVTWHFHGSGKRP